MTIWQTAKQFSFMLNLQPVGVKRGVAVNPYSSVGVSTGANLSGMKVNTCENLQNQTLKERVIQTPGSLLL